jgi:hypothetical protein
VTEGDLFDYIGVDDQLVSGGVLTLAEIAQECSLNPIDDQEISDNDIEEITETPLVTAKDARNGLRALQSYVERNSNDLAVLNMCDKLDDFMAEECLSKMKQCQITDFFKKQ